MVAVYLSGCAALLQGPRQTIQANSSPSGAVVKVTSGGMEFTTPASLSLERKYDYVLTFSKEGYKPVKVQVTRKLDVGMVVLDALFTGLIGVVVDAETGAWYDLVPEVVAVSLEPANVSMLLPIDIRLKLLPAEGDEIMFIASTVSGVKVHVDVVAD